MEFLTSSHSREMDRLRLFSPLNTYINEQRDDKVSRWCGMTEMNRKQLLGISCNTGRRAFNEWVINTIQLKWCSGTNNSMMDHVAMVVATRTDGCDQLHTCLWRKWWKWTWMLASFRNCAAVPFPALWFTVHSTQGQWGHFMHLISVMNVGYWHIILLLSALVVCKRCARSILMACEMHVERHAMPIWQVSVHRRSKQM